MSHGTSSLVLRSAMASDRLFGDRFERRVNDDAALHAGPTVFDGAGLRFQMGGAQPMSVVGDAYLRRG
jgi:hypothetical protein